MNTWTKTNQHWLLKAEYVNAGLEKAKGAMFMGVPLEELTRDELLAVAVNLAEDRNNQGWRG